MNTMPTPVIPLTHSSDYGLCLQDPLLYYWRRILGLSCPLEYSKAFSLGRKFHLCYELSDSSGAIDHGALGDRSIIDLDETLTSLQLSGVSEDRCRDYLLRERVDLQIATSFFEAAIKIPAGRYTLPQFIAAKGWELLGSEIELVTPSPVLPGISGPLPDSVIRIDRLYHSPKTNTLWILDPKTCGCPPETRAQKCPIEFQTFHYLETLRAAVESGDWINRDWIRSNIMVDTLRDATVGGMVHWIVQKPTIIFGSQDRPYSYIAHSKRSGKIARADFKDGHWTIYRKPDIKGNEEEPAFLTTDEEQVVEALEEYAGVKAHKEFAGDPSVELYTARCDQWYKEIEEDHCPVEISCTLALTPSDRAEYHRMLKFVHSHALREPEPSNFRYNPETTVSGHSVSRWAPFLLCPRAQWPEIIRRGNFIVSRRD